MAKTGVLLMAYGGPEGLDDVGPFMEHLTGRVPSPELLAAVQRKYAAIGGSSPLRRIAERIAERLQAELVRRGHEVGVTVGMRYWHPFIAEALDAMAAEGVTRVVTVGLSAFDSNRSSGAYRQAVAEALATRPGLEAVEAGSFRWDPAFVDALVAYCRDAMAELPEGVPAAVLFTAHSLPLDEVGDDPYEAQLRETAATVAERCGLEPVAEDGAQRWLPGVDAFGSDAGEPGGTPWLFAWQSRGAKPGAWLGPDLADVMGALHAEGFEGVVVDPIGFATDHMETIFDLDIVAGRTASDLGLAFVRAAVPNDSPAMTTALADVVEPLLT